MSRLRFAMTALVLAVFAGVVGTHILISPSVVSADIGGGRAGPRGATGRTGPTGPNWTTCAELASSMTNEVGTCGSLGGPLLSASPTTTGTLTAAGISAVTGAFSSTLDVAGAVGITGAVTARAGVTITPTSGVALTVTAPAATAGIVATGSTSATSISGSATTGTGVAGVATGGSGVGVRATCNTADCYALSVNGDTTGPLAAPMFMSVADANPSATCAIGGSFIFTGGYWRMCTATTPVWNDIGGFFSVTTGVTAFAGGGQASATAICASAAQTTVATVASAGDSVKFPATPVVGQICRVKNKGANSLNLFPGSGDAICDSGSACGAANAALAVAANAQVDCYAESASTWNCK